MAVGEFDRLLDVKGSRISERDYHAIEGLIAFARRHGDENTTIVAS